jgi:hypothetical protein
MAVQPAGGPARPRYRPGRDGGNGWEGDRPLPRREAPGPDILLTTGSDRDRNGDFRVFHGETQTSEAIWGWRLHARRSRNLDPTRAADSGGYVDIAQCG